MKDCNQQCRLFYVLRNVIENIHRNFSLAKKTRKYYGIAKYNMTAQYTQYKTDGDEINHLCSCTSFYYSICYAHQNKMGTINLSVLK